MGAADPIDICYIGIDIAYIGADIGIDYTYIWAPVSLRFCDILLSLGYFFLAKKLPIADERLPINPALLFFGAESDDNNFVAYESDCIC